MEKITAKKYFGDEHHDYIDPDWGVPTSIPAEMVNHPAHYNVGKIEVIDFIEDQRLDFHLGNAVKYICRAPYKAKTVEDLRKAIWYIERYLDNKARQRTKGETVCTLNATGVLVNTASTSTKNPTTTR